MHTALYDGLTVTPRDVWVTPGPQDAPWQMIWRRECVIESDKSESYRSSGETRTVFELEGMVVRLVVPGQQESVLRSTTKRLLRSESFEEMAADMMVNGKSFP